MFVDCMESAMCIIECLEHKSNSIKMDKPLRQLQTCLTSKGKMHLIYRRFLFLNSALGYYPFSDLNAFRMCCLFT